MGLRESDQSSASARGAFAVLVGPDGVGKTTVAWEMIRQHSGCTGYVHFRPPFWSALDPGPVSTEQVFRPKARVGGLVLAGLVRITWSLFVFWAGYLRRVRPAVRRGCLVVSDRWGYGYLAQPTALGFHGPAWVARMVARFLPRPDLVAALEAPVEVINARKAELSPEEIAQEIERYRHLPVPNHLVVDATPAPAETAYHLRQVLGLERAD